MFKKGAFETAKDQDYDVWNLSAPYIFFKIFKFMELFDSYEVVARYGRESLNDIVPIKEFAWRRKEALDRYLVSLKFIISNSKFIIIDKETLDKFRDRVDALIKNIHLTNNMQQDQLTKSNILVIEEQKFNYILTQARNIYEDVSILLNNAGLIFRKKEDFDLDAIKSHFINIA